MSEAKRRDVNGGPGLGPGSMHDHVRREQGKARAEAEAAFLVQVAEIKARIDTAERRAADAIAAKEAAETRAELAEVARGDMVDQVTELQAQLREAEHGR